jgi:hypothetical protein
MKTNISPSVASGYDNRGKKLLLFAALSGLVGAIAYFSARNQILVPVGVVLAIIAAYALFKWREFATLLFVFILYTNLAVVAIRYHGVPGIVAGAFFLLPALPMANYIFQHRQRIIFDRPFFLIVVYLLALITTSIFAKDLKLAWGEILNFLTEGLLLYFLLLNVIREPTTLKRVIWVLLFAGSLLGGISLLQELTHTYDNNYGGLSIRREDLDIDEVDFNAYSGARSAGGPIGDENRYGQILLVILPLALFCLLFRGARLSRLRP